MATTMPLLSDGNQERRILRDDSGVMSRHLLAALTALVLGTGQAAAEASPDSNARLAELQQWMGLAAQRDAGAYRRRRVEWFDPEPRVAARACAALILRRFVLLLCERCARPPQADKFKTEYVKGGRRQRLFSHGFLYISATSRPSSSAVEATLDVNDSSENRFPA